MSFRIVPGGDFKWKGYFMAAVKVEQHRQIHLWPQREGNSLCGQRHWFRDVIDREVATGWPDCNECKNEAFRRMLV